MEPGVLVEEVDAEGGGGLVGPPEEVVSAGRICPPSGSDSPAQIPRGSVLSPWLFLSPVKEDGRHQICRWPSDILLIYFI